MTEPYDFANNRYTFAPFLLRDRSKPMTAQELVNVTTALGDLVNSLSVACADRAESRHFRHAGRAWDELYELRKALQEQAAKETRQERIA